jgi:hypothetical protein
LLVEHVGLHRGTGILLGADLGIGDRRHHARHEDALEHHVVGPEGHEHDVRSGLIVGRVEVRLWWPGRRTGRGRPHVDDGRAVRLPDLLRRFVKEFDPWLLPEL